jgi:predicted RNA-binding Zn ribbon-like protein
MGETVFDFESGDLSLDFANTKDWHASQKPEENLHDYADLIAWGEQAGLVTSALAGILRSQADEHPEAVNRAYDRAILLREALYHTFSSHYAGKPIPASDLALLNSVLREAMAGLQLAPGEAQLRWEWAPVMEGANYILWPVARAAADLLTSDKVARVRVCEDDRGCGYLFIDQSKNHSRRWCSMEGCGNRAKARRHYSKIQST